MRLEKGIIIILLLTILFCFQCKSNYERQSSDSGDIVIWHKQPAKIWKSDAYPIGNGRLGAMIFGRTANERIQLNEESLWAGQPMNNNNPGALKHLKTIQQLLLDGKNQKALSLADKFITGTPPEIRSYQTLGDLFLDFPIDTNTVTNYNRSLDLTKGIAGISFKSGKDLYEREIFASAPANLIAIYLVGKNNAEISMAIRFKREKDVKITTKGNNKLIMTGQVIDEPNILKGPAGAHMKFETQLIARNEGGKVVAQGSILKVSNANSVLLLLTAATDYNINSLNFNRSVNPSEICNSILAKAEKRSYRSLKNDHIKEYQSMFNRVDFKLTDEEKDTIPTDIRLARVKAGGEDQHLIEMYFQYGRYLLMSSSRFPGVLPANLQGIWNDKLNVLWNSDFHTNINLQMNYWPADLCNLSECFTPYTNFIDKVRVPGRITAKEMYGASGWTMHHLTDAFGSTGVMDAVKWGMFPMGASWVSLSFWEHFQFTSDTVYLRSQAFPIMKEAALFVMDFLIEDKNGQLVTAPSYSPENTFYMPGTKEEMRLTYAPTMDIQIIRELFEACIRAGVILHDDPGFIDRLRNTIIKLPPTKIGKDNTIMEWIKEYEEQEPGHRHMSHLFGLYPGTQINPSTPELYNAARRTLDKRLSYGGGQTGWSRAWLINFSARLLDGDNSYNHLLMLLRQSTFNNLLDNCGPFQIDGNLGATAGIAEMLLQSQSGEINILPAFPKVWKEGHIKGIKARGNYTVNIFWKNNQLDKLEIRSGNSRLTRIRYKDIVKEVEMKTGIIYTFNSQLIRI